MDLPLPDGRPLYHPKGINQDRQTRQAHEKANRYPNGNHQRLWPWIGAAISPHQELIQRIGSVTERPSLALWLVRGIFL